MQSHDYVPGVSGWKFHKETGEFEINSCIFGSASKAPERQMVSVEVASYSKYDLPKNAANLVQFMEAELQKVPEQYRHSAEFEEFDASYGDESFNSRLFLSYARLETEEELADRLEKAKVAGTRIVNSGGCTTIIVDGVVRARFGDLDQPEPVTEQSQSFKADGDKVYLNEAFVDDGSVAKAKIGAGFYVHIPGVYVDADGRLHVNREDASSDEGCDSKLSANWSIKMQLHKGQYVVAGIGLGYPSQFLVSADRFVIQERARSSDSGDALAMAIKGWDGAGSALKACASLAVIDRIATVIGQTALCKELVEEIGKIHPRGKIGELEDKVDALRKDLDQLNLERIGEKGNADGASILLDRRLESIEYRLTNLESNRFRRPDIN